MPDLLRQHPIRGAGTVAVLALLVAGCGSPEPTATEATTEAATEATAPAPETTAPASPPAPRPSSTPTQPATSSPAPTPAVPVSVRIPALGLDEDLIDLGLTDTGALEVPADPGRVGWFTGGGRPAGPGPTVVVGHLDSLDGPAVFARLPELAPGDRIEMTTADGRQRRYVVEEARDVPQTPFPTEEVFGATPTDVLRLITCTGPYDSAAGRYTENRIVTAVPA